MQNEVLISSATKHNWLRLNVNEQDLTQKLTSRANKRLSKKTIIPVEYFVNRKNIHVLEKVLSKSYDIENTIYTLAINELIANKLLKLKNNLPFSSNEYILEILYEYSKGRIDINNELLKIKLPQKERDFLGIVYQSLLSEGSKNQKGSYYTPHKIIDNILTDIDDDATFLDPCCGTGSFLISASKKIKNPNNIYGFDLDKTACFIAKINLVLKYKNIKFRPNIYNSDFITESKVTKKFDVIATNPPWGASDTSKYKKKFPQIISGESYSYFIYKASKMVKENGNLYFILPESILNVKTHRDIRCFILENFHINNINLIGKPFSGVLSNVVILNLDKDFDTPEVTIKFGRKIKHINQEFYRQNVNNNFSILDNKDVEILNKIYKTEHYNLDENSFWALGVVTGNNAKYVSENSDIGEKIYSGKNILKGKITDSNKYLKYDRAKFQQTASDKIYRAKEKLVYKFISKRLVFAYDNEQRLFLNSANILIPKIKGYSVRTVMEFLNSTLFQYIYSKRFNEIKILKGNLMELPFPKYDKKQYPKIDDNTIFKIFNMTKSEITYIKREVIR
ncbi:N-6 DNA methylase [bacterium]|nr:N-6 DNA methylase [bacterium]